MVPLLAWLVQGAVGPALVGLPVTWGAADLAHAARQWFGRLRRSDGLSRIVVAASVGAGLSGAEFRAVRDLLEQDATWVMAGRGTVEDLAERIAACLSGGDDEALLVRGRAIAAGLLEFAVRDLEPEWYRQVLFARLERVQAAQASALDEAMLSVHGDLAALFAARDVADAQRSALVLGHLAVVLDRLPPGPADPAQVGVYLAVLIKWLSADPWPRDTRFGAAELEAADMERKLRLSRGREADLDADELSRRCSRLVVLGGPGSGKTWLARRAARLCAEEALEKLAVGAELDEVELPVYTTCARLAAVPPGDSIRRAVVVSALGQMPDLGGARAVDAIRRLLEERNAPTVLIADSLDEAGGLDYRVRQCDSLPATWRIILTSRPGSWNGQLTAPDGDPNRIAAILQPLRYPEDVEPFISCWFGNDPTLGADVVKQLRDRPALRHAATVPLILAFYCIIGAGQLPDRRADLYARVIGRMLTGRWRGDSRADLDLDACRDTLRGWAWAAATADPHTGVGAWTDDIATPRIRLDPDDREALGHLAVPLGLPDPDTGMTIRRFVHRSVREYLVAEHVAKTMPADQAAQELLGHLWFDPDWEYAAPAALAMHPDREEVLNGVMRHITGSRRLPVDLSVIDGCWEIRRFLARVAQESSETDWSPEAATMIARARQDIALVDLPRGAPNGVRLHGEQMKGIHEITARGWPSSNSVILESLFQMLDSVMRDSDASGSETQILAGILAPLALTSGSQARTRGTLLRMLTRHDRADEWKIQCLAKALTELDAPARDRMQASEILLRRLPDAVLWKASFLLDGAVHLAVTAEEQARTREALLRMLSSETALLRLASSEKDPVNARRAAQAISELSPTARECARAREALMGLLSRETDATRSRHLACAFRGLAPSPAEREQIVDTVLRLVPAETHPGSAWRLVRQPHFAR
jgi:hypothetical protein